MNYDLILVRYGELALKSEYVRKQFESILSRNIKNAFKFKQISCKITSERGRIFISTGEINKGLKVLKRIFGITSFSPVIKTSSEISEMNKTALDFSQKILNNKKSFALRVNRTGDHEFTSQEFAANIGSAIVKATKAKVDLSIPDFELFIDIRNEISYFFTEKIRGTGGLPLGTQGKIIVLIENEHSLLAAWYLMRRGCSIVFVIKNYKFIDITHQFIENWFADLDIVIFDEKKLMFYDFLNNIANEKVCNAIVTGYTIFDPSVNMFSTISDMKKNTILPILHPLIAMDFEEINKKCKELGIVT